MLNIQNQSNVFKRELYWFNYVQFPMFPSSPLYGHCRIFPRQHHCDVNDDVHKKVFPIWLISFLFGLLMKRVFHFWLMILKPSCDTRFQRAITACVCVFWVITLCEPTKVTSLKTKQHAVNACWKRVWQRALTKPHRDN